MAFIQKLQGPVTNVTPATGPGLQGGGDASLRKLQFTAFGTQCELQYVCMDATAAAAFEQDALNWACGFQAKYSRFVPESIISQINAAAGKDWVAIDADTESLFQLCDSLHFLTKGMLDPTTLPITRLWDVKSTNPRIPTESEVKSTLRLVGWPKVKRAKGRIFLPETGMALDLGGFGKEYAVDAVAEIAKHHGLTNVLVDFGHDLRCFGRPPHGNFWHVGLEDPNQPGSAWAGVAISNCGMASSGNYVRCFIRDGKRYGHIVDPRTGYPVNNDTLATYVIGGSCLEAGILSTSCYILGAVEGIALINATYGVEGCIFTQRERLYSQQFYKYLVKSA
ncbi:MAG: FAD:protein FMN transferase [Verrucomicrobiota bacterium]|nr:FAD:protein FMN transferase [Verrucomicrobiota bacterium]